MSKGIREGDKIQKDVSYRSAWHRDLVDLSSRWLEVVLGRGRTAALTLARVPSTYRFFVSVSCEIPVQIRSIVNRMILKRFVRPLHENFLESFDWNY